MDALVVAVNNLPMDEKVWLAILARDNLMAQMAPALLAHNPNMRPETLAKTTAEYVEALMVERGGY